MSAKRQLPRGWLEAALTTLEQAGLIEIRSAAEQFALTPPEVGADGKPVQSKPDRARQLVVQMWPLCREAARKHGKHWVGLSAGRMAAMARCLREHPGLPPQILVYAVHGAVAAWKGTDARPGFDPLQFLRPETIYSSKFSHYLEAYGEAHGAIVGDPETQPGARPDPAMQASEDDVAALFGNKLA